MKTHKPSITNLIAQGIECGNDCYYNIKTQEVVGFPEKNYYWDDSDYEDAFGEELKKIKKHKKDFIKIEAVKSFESFKIMEDFVKQLPDTSFKFELIDLLQKPKPFKNFKYNVENSDFRTNWFEFKMNQLEIKYKEQIENIHN